jgi:phage shock protein A
MPPKSRRRVRRIPKGRRFDVRREEFNQLVDILNDRGKILERIIQDLQIQFQRLAQLQAEVDRLKRASPRTKN